MGLSPQTVLQWHVSCYFLWGTIFALGSTILVWGAQAVIWGHGPEMPPRGAGPAEKNIKNFVGVSPIYLAWLCKTE